MMVSKDLQHGTKGEAMNNCARLFLYSALIGNLAWFIVVSIINSSKVEAAVVQQQELPFSTTAPFHHASTREQQPWNNGKTTLCSGLISRKRATTRPTISRSSVSLQQIRGGAAAATSVPLPPPSSSSSNANAAAAASMNKNHKLLRRFGDNRSMPSLFSSDESVFDKYAACLAATEGLRRIRDRELAEARRAARSQSSATTTTSNANAASADAQEEKQIRANYVRNSIRILRTLGMTVDQFNDLGREISLDERLKEKVMEQAYLYRMAATISIDRIPTLDSTAESSSLPTAGGGRGSALYGSSAVDPRPRGAASHHQQQQQQQPDKIQMFCDSMFEIERLREDQVERLVRSLKVQSFPERVNMSDPGLVPFLSPRVRAVVEAFPLQAQEIVHKHGLDPEEFNRMLRETKSNPLFRWRIQKQLSSSSGAAVTRDQQQQSSSSETPRQ